MPSYRRWRVEGGAYFLVVVTHERRPLFQDAWARRLLRQAIADVRRKRPFAMEAIVLLPDHLHMIWRLPEGDSAFSTRMAAIKKRFTDAYLAGGGTEGTSTRSRARHRVRGVWEKRFYEHAIRGPKDYRMHFDYLHLNPVKHGLAVRPRDWRFSSFHRYVRAGVYDQDWCGDQRLPGVTYLEPRWA